MDRFSFFRMLGESVYRIDSAYDVFAKSSGIKPNMLWLLSALNDGKPHTQHQICWDWNYPKTTVNTLVKELERQGYVTLAPVSGSGRELYIELTKAGKAYADEVLRPVYETEDKLFQLYVKGHETEFVKQLDAFSNIMKLYFDTGKYVEPPSENSEAKNT